MSAESSLSSFSSPDRHAAVSDILRRRSTNHVDVRVALLRDLDLSGVHEVLDLGCGFGFMTETVSQRIAPEARIVGVDACPANEQPYLDRVRRSGCTAQFTCRHIDTRLDWPDGAFDLVLASYAVYFFPGVLPETARVLRPDGLLIAITHTESSCAELVRILDLPEFDSPLISTIRQFSVENARDRLTPWFGKIERIDYGNTLVFEEEHVADLLVYVRFRLPLLFPGAEACSEVPEPLERTIRAVLARRGRVVLEKHDAAFVCREPRCR